MWNTISYYTVLYVNGSQNTTRPKKTLVSCTPGIQSRRQNEAAASDTFFRSITSDWGDTCSQMIVGTDLERWEVYPLKTESLNGVAWTSRRWTMALLGYDKQNCENQLEWMKHFWAPNKASRTYNTYTCHQNHLYWKPMWVNYIEKPNIGSHATPRYSVPI
jgi:hypothetical protein